MAQVVVVRGHMVDDRTVELEEPVDRSVPVAELRVKLQPAKARQPGLVEFLESLPPGTRSKEEIDAELEADRDSWG
jgi:hypothetical protein